MTLTVSNFSKSVLSAVRTSTTAGEVRDKMDINLNMKMFAIFRLRFRSAMLESMEKSLSCAKGSQNLRQSKQKEIGDWRF